MTGEMLWIDPVTGEDSDGNVWFIHAMIAKLTGGQVTPFDMYQGPYVAIGGDLTAGLSPYAIPVKLPGIVRVWVQASLEDVDAIVLYREDTKMASFPFFVWYTKKGVDEVALQNNVETALIELGLLEAEEEEL